MNAVARALPRALLALTFLGCGRTGIEAGAAACAADLSGTLCDVNDPAIVARLFPLPLTENVLGATGHCLAQPSAQAAPFCTRPCTADADCGASSNIPAARGLRTPLRRSASEDLAQSSA